jgi:hypothetical protein
MKGFLTVKSHYLMIILVKNINIKKNIPEHFLSPSSEKRKIMRSSSRMFSREAKDYERFIDLGEPKYLAANTII